MIVMRTKPYTVATASSLTASVYEFNSPRKDATILTAEVAVMREVAEMAAEMALVGAEEAEEEEEEVMVNSRLRLVDFRRVPLGKT